MVMDRSDVQAHPNGMLFFLLFSSLIIPYREQVLLVFLSSVPTCRDVIVAQSCNEKHADCSQLQYMDLHNGCI